MWTYQFLFQKGTVVSILKKGTIEENQLTIMYTTRGERRVFSGQSKKVCVESQLNRRTYTVNIVYIYFRVMSTALSLRRQVHL